MINTCEGRISNRGDSWSSSDVSDVRWNVAAEAWAGAGVVADDVGPGWEDENERLDIELVNRDCKIRGLAVGGQREHREQVRRAARRGC